MNIPTDRRAYEGPGGWNDGRLGQAYDLIVAVLTDQCEKVQGNEVLRLIVDMDFAGGNA